MTRRRILVVDDEPDMLDFLERVFRKDFEVVRAANATEALAVLARERVDVLVTDDKMPRVGGIELLARAADQHPDMVRILVSGFTCEDEVQRAAARCKIHGHVSKPVDSQGLRAAVRDALALEQAGRSSD